MVPLHACGVRRPRASGHDTRRGELQLLGASTWISFSWTFSRRLRSGDKLTTGSLGFFRLLPYGQISPSFFWVVSACRKIPLKNDAALNASFHDVLDGFANRGGGFCLKKAEGVCDNLKKRYIYIQYIIYINQKYSAYFHQI